jgi:hypothetical protein
MTDRDDDHERRMPALGQPPEGKDTLPAGLRREHDRTAVDRDVVTGEDEDEREPESPRGWSGMQR